MLHAVNIAALGFDAQNAKVCAAYSSSAYTAAPDITGPGNTAVLVRDLDNCIVLAFQGTKSLPQFLTDSEAWNKRLDDCCIHWGFWTALSSVIQQIETKLATLNWSAHKPVILTGHSLGGALAMICAFRLAQTQPLDYVHSVYTFGQPRCGDASFKKIYNAITITLPYSQGVSGMTLYERTFRFVNEEDIVPRLPLWFRSFYHHAGQSLFFSRLSTTLTWNPTWWKFLLSDVIGFIAAYRNRQDVLLAKHHMAGYEMKVSELP